MAITRSNNLKLLFGAGIIVLAGAVFLVWVKLAKAPETVYCPQDARQCPDGSYVGRIAPSCDFAACPSGSSTCASTETCVTASSSLKTEIDQEQGIEYQYLEKLPTIYIQPQDWPPTVKVSDEVFACQGTPASTSTLEVVAQERTIEGHGYCVKESVGAAAGSRYTTYVYSTLKDGKLATVSFTLRAPECANYDEPKRTACQVERTDFNPDSLVLPIIGSLKIKPEQSL